MRSKWHLPTLATAALLAGLVTGSGSLALWNDQGDVPVRMVTSGNLDIEAVGDPVWTETSTDVTDAPKVIDPATFLVRPGDTFTITQDFTTTLQGDNMLGELAVDWPTSTKPNLPNGVSGSYMVLDADDNELLGSWTALGTGATLTDDLDTDDTGRTDTFTVVVELDFANMADRFGAGSTLQTADLGTFRMTLDQTRDGVGFE